MNDYRLDTTALSVLAKDKVLEYIDAADLGSTRKLPREEKLAQIIGVSRVTLRTALNELAVAGIITRQQGRGTFVSAAAANMDAPLSPMAEFKDMIRASGYEPTVEVLGVEVKDDGGDDAVRLGLPPGSPVAESRTMFLADGQFCALCIDHFPLSLLGDAEALADFSTYRDRWRSRRIR